MNLPCRVRPFSVLCLLFSGLQFGCAYHWGHHERAIPGGYDRMAVPIFNNSSQEAGAEIDFTKALIEEVERNGLASIIPHSESQVVIEGRLENVEYRQGPRVKKEDEGYDDLPEDTLLTREYRVFAQVYLQLRRRSDRKIIWFGRFNGERRYSAPQVTKTVLNTVNPLYNHSARRSVLSTLARDLMAEAYSNMTENF